MKVIHKNDTVFYNVHKYNITTYQLSTLHLYNMVCLWQTQNFCQFFSRLIFNVTMCSYRAFEYEMPWYVRIFMCKKLQFQSN